jgi:hypothetical protein
MSWQKKEIYAIKLHASQNMDLIETVPLFKEFKILQYLQHIGKIDRPLQHIGKIDRPREVVIFLHICKMTKVLIFSSQLDVKLW